MGHSHLSYSPSPFSLPLFPANAHKRGNIARAQAGVIPLTDLDVLRLFQGMVYVRYDQVTFFAVRYSKSA